MARGWESKSVEEQMSAAEDRRPRDVSPEPSPEQQRLLREKNVLMLSIVRVEREIASCTHSRYLAILENALGDQKQKLVRIEQLLQSGTVGV
ncbi:MAG TPA: hypothetical protein VMZ52_14505 [Bryobacteraceae bacterium]|nr:hypothetical protein [Bryobacteraceae bacterium]